MEQKVIVNNSPSPKGNPPLQTHPLLYSLGDSLTTWKITKPIQSPEVSAAFLWLEVHYVAKRIRPFVITFA